MLYKYVGNEDPIKAVDYLKRFVIDRTIKATAPLQFNDPTEFKVNFTFDATEDEKIARARTLWPQRSKKDHERWARNRDAHAEWHDALMVRSGFLQLSGVICLTLDPDNFLMWSHYAHSHSGFCIGFADEVLDGLITKGCVAWDYVKYKEEPASVNFYNASEEDFGRAFFMHKSKDWNYEKEYRLVFSQAGVKKINTSLIKEIVLGCRVSSELEKYARTFIGSGIGVFKMRESVSSYQLEKIELKDDVHF